MDHGSEVTQDCRPHLHMTQHLFQCCLSLLHSRWSLASCLLAISTKIKIKILVSRILVIEKKKKQSMFVLLPDWLNDSLGNLQQPGRLLGKALA